MAFNAFSAWKIPLEFPVKNSQLLAGVTQSNSVVASEMELKRLLTAKKRQLGQAQDLFQQTEAILVPCVTFLKTSPFLLFSFKAFLLE